MKIFWVVFSLILFSSYTEVIYSAPKSKKRVKKSSAYKSVILKDTVLVDGLKYMNILFGSRKNKISTNILEFDITNPNLIFSVLKAKKNITELDKLQEIIRYNDSIDGGKIIAAINASFWRAYSNNPIGACIIDGNVVEMNPYKEWSGFFINTNNEPYIDNFKISGSIKLHDGKIISISTVNRRRDSIGVVFYNHYGGEVIPHLNKSLVENKISQAYIDLLQDSIFMNGDSTEVEFSFEEFEKNLIENARSEKIENSITKAVIEFIDIPCINKPFKAIVNYIDTGSVKINQNQAIISLGFNLPPDISIIYGDTLELNFSTNIHSKVNFQHAITATPRLVRGGIADHEASKEGSKSRRFINGQLGRSAIGYNKNKDKIYLVTVDHANRSLKKKGASLGELAQIMKQIGCYDAMNLDGGGSSVMVVDGKNIMSKNNPNASRKISVGVGIRQFKK
jgi:hypothetical protein